MGFVSHSSTFSQDLSFFVPFLSTQSYSAPALPIDVRLCDIYFLPQNYWDDGMMANFCKQQTNYINVLLVVRSISNWFYALFFHCIILMAYFTWERNGIIYQFQTWCFTFSCAMSMFAYPLDCRQLKIYRLTNIFCEFFSIPVNFYYRVIIGRLFQTSLDKVLW